MCMHADWCDVISVLFFLRALCLIATATVKLGFMHNDNIGINGCTAKCGDGTLARFRVLLRLSAIARQSI